MCLIQCMYLAYTIWKEKWNGEDAAWKTQVISKNLLNFNLVHLD